MADTNVLQSAFAGLKTKKRVAKEKTRVSLLTLRFTSETDTKIYNAIKSVAGQMGVNEKDASKMLTVLALIAGEVIDPSIRDEVVAQINGDNEEDGDNDGDDDI
jgi:hypothetical protein